VHVTVAAHGDEAVQLLHDATSPESVSPESAFHIVVVGAAARSSRPAHVVAEEISDRTDTRRLPLLLLSLTGHTEVSPPGRWERCCAVNTPVSENELRTAILQTLGTAHHQPRHADEHVPGEEIRPLRILLAEDCLVNREVAIGLLELRGHQVVPVSSGREAVDALQTAAFDVLLMDVEMPEMDGIEATRLIRATERASHRRTPIIAMTAHAVSGFQDACLQAGMDGYISKPVDPQTLYRIVETTAERHAPQSAVWPEPVA
jgi:CheY-like chemotaxis protein